MSMERKKQEPMTADEQKVYLSLVETARKAACAFARRHRLDHEEAVAEAMLLLVGVMREFNPAINGGIKGFVGSRVKFRLMDAYRAKNNFGVSVCGYRTTQKDGRDAVTTTLGSALDGTPMALTRQVDHADSDLEARSMLDRLKTTGVKWEMVEVLLGWTTSVELSRRLGLTESRVSQMRTAAIRLLQGVEWLQREVEL